MSVLRQKKDWLSLKGFLIKKISGIQCQIIDLHTKNTVEITKKVVSRFNNRGKFQKGSKSYPQIKRATTLSQDRINLTLIFQQKIFEKSFPEPILLKF